MTIKTEAEAKKAFDEIGQLTMSLLGQHSIEECRRIDRRITELGDALSNYRGPQA